MKGQVKTAFGDTNRPSEKGRDDAPTDQARRVPDGNTQAVTFCFSDIFHVIYSVQRERGGFGSVHTNSDLNSCPSGCRNFGGVTAGSPVGVFCQHNGAYLVYVDNSALVGFLPANRVTVQGYPAQC